MATSGTYYFDSPSFSSATSIYTDEALTTCAPDGIYSDGTITRRQINCVLEVAETCPDCLYFTFNKTTAKGSSLLACSDSTSSNIYFNTLTPGDGDVGYTDTGLTTPFVGGDSFYGLDQSTTTPSFSVVISDLGVLSSKTTCVAPPPVPTAPPPVPTAPPPVPTAPPPVPTTPPPVPVPPTYNYYSAAPCEGGSTVYFRTLGSYSAGEAVKIDAYGDVCYQVIAGGAPSNTNNVTATYVDCTDCLPTPPPVPTAPPPVPTTPPPVPTPTTNYFYLKYCDTGADVFCGGVQQTLSDNTGTWSIGNSFYNTCVSACTYLSTTAPSGSVSGNVDGSTVTRYNSCASCVTPTPPTPPTPTPATPVWNLALCSGGIANQQIAYDSNYDIGVVILASNGICYVIDSYEANGAPTQTVSQEFASCSECNSPTPPTPPTPTAPTPPTPTPPVSVWYQMTDCADSSTKYSQQYNEGTFSINDRVTAPGGLTLIITGEELADPGVTLYAITATGLTGCPPAPTPPTPVPVAPTPPTPTPPVSVWYQMTDCSDSSTIYSQQYNEGDFAINERVTSLGGLTAVITGELLADPGGFLYAITSTGQTGCP